MVVFVVLWCLVKFSQHVRNKLLFRRLWFKVGKPVFADHPFSTPSDKVSYWVSFHLICCWFRAWLESLFIFLVGCPPFLASEVKVMDGKKWRWFFGWIDVWGRMIKCCRCHCQNVYLTFQISKSQDVRSTQRRERIWQQFMSVLLNWHGVGTRENIRMCESLAGCTVRR